MVDRYWRKIEDVENYIENSMQISSILLKLKGFDEILGDLSKIGNNENNISSNLGKININETNSINSFLKFLYFFLHVFRRIIIIINIQFTYFTFCFF